MTKETNVASTAGGDVSEREIVPMTLPVLRLEVPEIPGYVLYWMRGTSSRIAQAQRAGYEFVNDDEVTLNNRDLGGDATHTGSTDMGSRVTVLTGDEIGHDGQPVRLILMKVKKEYWDKAQAVLLDRSNKTAAAMRAGLVGAERDAPGDTQHRYVKGKVPDLFNPNRTRRPS